jgi:hypothetical protein
VSQGKYMDNAILLPSWAVIKKLSVEDRCLVVILASWLTVTWFLSMNVLHRQLLVLWKRWILCQVNYIFYLGGGTHGSYLRFQERNLRDFYVTPLHLLKVLATFSGMGVSQLFVLESP